MKGFVKEMSLEWKCECSITQWNNLAAN